MEKNFGLSDAWLGLKFRVREGAWPQAVRATWRTPFLYDQPGPYARHLYRVRKDHLQSAFQGVVDSTAFVMNSPEWRGLLRNDLTLTYAVSHSFRRFQGWMSLEAGYDFRQGAPSDDIPMNFEVGYALPFRSCRPYLKASLNLVKSVGNNSIAAPEDRFGTTSTFNNASILRGGVSLIFPFFQQKMSLEAGYSQWLWGRGARQYREPFFSVGRSF